jgi:hypothetical protein
MRSTLGGHIRALARAQAQAARSRAMTGSGQHLASVLQEGWENANIDVGLGFIWTISVQGGTDMLRLFESASIFVIALGLAGLPARAQSSSDATSKSLRVAQNVSPTQVEEQRAAKSVACRKQAKEQKLSGSKRRAFLKDCMRK